MENTIVNMFGEQPSSRNRSDAKSTSLRARHPVLKSTRGPMPAKQLNIQQSIRSQIVKGDLQPGGRLPTQVELVDQFGVSGVTVQRALEGLMLDGFIESRGRRGTFVVDKPPHLNHFAMVFTSDFHSTKGARSRFYNLLSSVVHDLEVRRDCKIDVLTNISGQKDDLLGEQLLDDARSDRYAGLIFVNPYELQNHPLVTDPSISRVAIMSQTTIAGLPVIFPDIRGLVDAGMQELANAGVQRPGVIISVPMFTFIDDYLFNAAKKFNLDLKPFRTQIVTTECQQAAQNTAHMMMTIEEEQRPDGLFILDDSLVEGSIAGLVAVGVGSGPTLPVVVHCNFPGPSYSALPVTQIGFDIAELVNTCLDDILVIRRGQTLPSYTHLPPRREQMETSLS